MFKYARRWIRRWITDIRPAYAMGTPPSLVPKGPDPTKTTSTPVHPKVLVPLIVGFVVSLIAGFAASKGYALPANGDVYLTGILMAIAGYFAPNAP